MMLGAAGTLCCLTAGTVLGIYLRDRRLARVQLLNGLTDVLTGMRLLLVQERLGMGELLNECAAYAPRHPGAVRVAERLRSTADILARNPLTGVEGAYVGACRQIPIPWEQAEERETLNNLFLQLGSGTAAMREQAVAACLRRLKPVAEQAQEKAEKGGKLCMQLGMLLGLMAGIALW